MENYERGRGRRRHSTRGSHVVASGWCRDSKWLPRGWNKEDIVFFGNEDNLFDTEYPFLLERFGNVNTEGEARAALHPLRQGPNQPFSAFHAKYMELRSRIPA